MARSAARRSRSWAECPEHPQVWIPPRLDLGPPADGQEVHRVGYWCQQRETGPGRYVHLYELDPADADMTSAARHPAPAWEGEDSDRSGKAPRRTFGAARKPRRVRPGVDVEPPTPRRSPRRSDDRSGVGLLQSASSWRGQ